MALSTGLFVGARSRLESWQDFSPQSLAILWLQPQNGEPRANQKSNITSEFGICWGSICF